eukprot:g741.t1
MSHETSRKKPNILITGTPGTGKTCTSELLAEATGFKHINVGDLIKENAFHCGKDKDFDSYVLDEASEEKLLDAMEIILADGGCIVDFHSCAFFPKRWFDIVLVIRTETQVLYDRLKKRGYSEKKIGENMECEIMQVVLDEARESYDARVVKELRGNTLEDLERNVEAIASWAKTQGLAK